ncbi:BSD domain-containing protein 1 [Elysia marginata]|uniref:BSD domain-containing protein 1 n=1 Tax=Elysia marginata TaxID=1093978 RepID=A0AAV4H6F9_9GAST|nr:BSD domain-containing protein 1 [Elysia marginata]
MAEGGSNTGSETETWENWFGGWMQTAKEKSQTALEFVKKDLAEFGTTVQKETEKAVEMTKGSLHSESTTEATKKVKAGLASFLDNISKVLVIPHDDDDYVPMKVAPDGSGLYDRGKARLHALQLDAGTYMDPPRGSPEQYSMWLESFSLDEHKGEISELLVSQVEVRALYTKLVPSEVSNADFWQRYFYRVHQLQCDEARKQALMMRADQTGGKESVSWDDDDEDEECCENEDDGNHSDWEKMPRPPQSYLSQQKSEGHKEGPTKESIPAGDDNKSAVKSACLPEQQASHESSKHSDKAEEKQAIRVDTGVSADAAEPSLKTSVSTTATSQNVDASGESTEWSPVEVLSNPWSLHIPEDLSSASDAVEEKSGEVQHDETNEGSAAGGEVIHQAHSTVSPADGACGAADFEPGQSEATQSPRLNIQTEEVSTAGSAEALQLPKIEPSTQEANADTSEAQVPRQSSRPQKLDPADELSDNSVEKSPKDTETESAVVVKQEDIRTVSDPQRVAKDRETDFKPVSKDEKDSVVEGKDVTTTQSTESKTDAGAIGGQASNEKEIGMRVKGDMVVVGDRDSPSSTESTDTKDLGLEDWEQDFDVEITEEDLKAAEDIAKRLGENLDDNVGLLESSHAPT